MQIESFSDYVRRRVPQCPSCRNIRNGDERCECQKGSPQMLRIPSDDELTADYQVLVEAHLKEPPRGHPDT